MGLREVNEEEEWMLYWTDLSVTLERVIAMKGFQVNLELSSFTLSIQGQDGSSLCVEEHLTPLVRSINLSNTFQ